MVLNANFCRSDKLGVLGELREAINEKPNIKEPVWHAMISLDKGEHLTNEQWQQATDEYIEKMGFSNCPFVVVKHHDTEHEHVHIIASRVSYDRQLVSDSFDYPRSQVVARDLEARFNLRSVPNSWDVSTRAKQQSEYNLTRRTGARTSRSVMVDALRQSAQKQDVLSVVDLKRTLDAQQIRMVPKTTRDDSKIVGVYFEHQGIRIPGSKLHKSFGWNRLRERFEFDAKRDQDILLNKRPVPPKRVAHAQPPPVPKATPQQGPKITSPEHARAQIAQGMLRANWDEGFHNWTKSLKAQGIEAVPKVTQADPKKITGMYFEYKGVQVTGSSIHKGLGFQGIQTRLGGYAPGRDYGAFEHVMVPGVGKRSIEATVKNPEEPKRQEPPQQHPNVALPELGPDNLSQRHRDVRAHPMLGHFVGQGTFDAKQMTAQGFVDLQRKAKQPWAMAKDVRMGQWTVMSKDLECADGRFAVLVNEKHQAIVLPYRRDLDVLRHRDVALTQTMQIRPVMPERYPINPMPEALEQYKPKSDAKPVQRQSFKEWAKSIKEDFGRDVSVLKDREVVRGKITKRDLLVKEGRFTLIERPDKTIVAVSRKHLEQAMGRSVDEMRGKQVMVVKRDNELKVNVQNQDRGMSR